VTVDVRFSKAQFSNLWIGLFSTHKLIKKPFSPEKILSVEELKIYFLELGTKKNFPFSNQVKLLESYLLNLKDIKKVKIYIINLKRDTNQIEIKRSTIKNFTLIKDSGN